MYLLKLAILTLIISFSHSERILKILWWFGKLKDDLSIENEQQNLGLIQKKSFKNDTTLGNLKGSYCISPEIDGSYRCAEIAYLTPDQYLFKKYSEVNTRSFIIQRWRFYRDDIEDEEMKSYENINLIFGGIDTYNELTIHMFQLNASSNMFIRQIFSIEKYYGMPAQYISLLTNPPVSHAEHQYNLYQKTGKINPSCPPASWNGDCHINMVRKMQSSFGSMIGPSLPSMGITGPAYLEAYNETVIRDILINLDGQNGNWNLNINVYFAGNKRNFVKGTIHIHIVDEIVKEAINITANSDKEYVYQKTINIKEQLNLWWPVGYGNQSLYELNIKFVSLSGEETSRVLKVGFRTIELVQDKLGQGSSFYFKVNGRPIFMKGTVLAPISLQPELAQDPKVIKKMLSLAVTHNMNMIRIWGGGIYQTDAFYDMADEMGFLIWQDFMFTDLSYPVNGSFLDSVREEIKYQVRRIYSHPSVVAFCGNDEGELSIFENRYNQTRYPNTKQDYQTLFINTMKTEFDKITFGKGIFITSTPSNGVPDAKIAQNPNSPLFGDAHVFKYEEDLFDHDTYSQVPRFASAYGIQSMPKLESFVKDTSIDKDLNIKAEFLASRQHWPDGMNKLTKMLEHQFVLGAADDWDWETYAKVFVYYSQVIQAYGMRIQTEKYRSFRSVENKDGSGKTMGALYWHYNDVWTAPTWSGIDFYGEWKILQYYVPKFFAPHIITGQLHKTSGKTSLNVFVVADATGLTNVKAKLKTGRFDGLGTNSEQTKTVSVDADSSKLVYSFGDIDNFLSKNNCSRKDCFIYLELEDNGKAVAPDNFILLNPIKDSNIGNPNVQIHIKKLPFVQVYEINITTKRNALFVWVDNHGIDGYFSDNGFLMIEPKKRIYFYSSKEVSEEKVQSKFSVRYIGYKDDDPPK